MPPLPPQEDALARLGRAKTAAWLVPPTGVWVLVLPVAMLEVPQVVRFFVIGAVYCVVVFGIAAAWAWSSPFGLRRARGVVLIAVGSAFAAWALALVVLVVSALGVAGAGP